MAALLAGPLPAETRKGANLETTAPARPGPVARLVLAQQLYLTGLAEKDALALLTAARLMARTGVILSPDRLPDMTGKRPKTLPPDPIPLPDAAATLATAAVLARGDEAILALIDTEKTAPPLPKGGVRQSQGSLPPKATDTWTLAFFGQSTAELAVLGNGASTLSITVADENGTPVCATTAASDRLYCRFTPSWNGDFTITVANPGPEVDSYLLLTN
jgi:hypothetical protein